jgi:hypothetical protein
MVFQNFKNKLFILINSTTGKHSYTVDVFPRRAGCFSETYGVMWILPTEITFNLVTKRHLNDAPFHFCHPAKCKIMKIIFRSIKKELFF